MDRHAAAQRTAADGVVLTTPRLLVIGELPEPHRRRITRAWPEAELTSATADAHRCGAILAWSYDPEPLIRVLTQQAPAPSRWVHTRAVGVDPRVTELVAATGSTLTNGSGAHGVAVAEHVLAMVLALLRQVPHLVRAQDNRRWQEDLAVTELSGKLVGVVGTGDLGRCTARLFRAFDTAVRGLRRTAIGVRHAPNDVPEVDDVYGPDALGDFLTGLDVLVIAAPLTRRTAGLIDADALSLLAPGCLVVNVGRGPIIDETALVAALHTGQLGGAALDVFDAEPLPPDSPLWAIPNVLISPHCADHTPQTDERFVTQYLKRIDQFRRGCPMSSTAS